MAACPPQTRALRPPIWQRIRGVRFSSANDDIKEADLEYLATFCGNLSIHACTHAGAAHSSAIIHRHLYISSSSCSLKVSALAASIQTKGRTNIERYIQLDLAINMISFKLVYEAGGRPGMPGDAHPGMPELQHSAARHPHIRKFKCTTCERRNHVITHANSTEGNFGRY